MKQLLRKIADWAWSNNLQGFVLFVRKFKKYFGETQHPEVSINVSELRKRLTPLQEFFNGKPLSILEIGPKSGTHSQFIDEFFHPSNMVFLERPSNEGRIEKASWASGLHCTSEFIYSDMLLKSKVTEYQFDIVFFLGVIYHNVEYFKMFYLLHKLLKPGGYLVLGTSLNYHANATIVLNYQKGQKYDLTRPSQKAITTIMEMTGIDLVEFHNLPYPNQRGLFIAKKGVPPDTAVDGYLFGGSTI